MGLRSDELIGRHVAQVLGDAVYAAYLTVAERLFSGEALRWECWMDCRFCSRHARRLPAIRSRSRMHRLSPERFASWW
jgi:hypothetical protein